MKVELNIFIHRRDFRIHDNSALNALCELYPDMPVLHIFIFNPTQIDPAKNKYFNANCVEFMIQSLLDLKHQLHDALYFFHGSDIDIIKKLMLTFRVNAIAWNEDYTPFSRARDAFLKNWCRQVKVGCVTREDYSLFDMNSIGTSTGKAYNVFTPFYNKCIALKDHIRYAREVPKSHHPFHAVKLANTVKNIHVYYNSLSNTNLKVRGGRDLALGILKNMGKFKNYDHFRDYPSADKTTKLSAYMKFGCVSCREVYAACKSVSSALVRELMWREFYAHAAWHFGFVGRKLAIEPKWNYNKGYYDKVMNAMTGFPIIDAGITELKTTGWINNRIRMIIASFITKDLMQDWRIYERDLFARYLIDYDPCTNHYSWQGQAGISHNIISTPYWRVMNPWRQTEKYDKDCKYCKKWLPAGLSTGEILNWRESWKFSAVKYPGPMVDHEIQVTKYLHKFAYKEK